jgi:hypothetical protein
VIAYKFLAPGAISPFTGFRWPGAGGWVHAPPGRDDAWVHACRVADLPCWLDEELWTVELGGPVREARYQLAAPRARLVRPVRGWDAPLRGEYARACALRARDLALPHLAPWLRDALRRDDLPGLVEAVSAVESPPPAAAYVADAARTALAAGPAPASYVACVLAATLGGGLAAFEAERAWQARWLAGRLGLEAGPRA